MSGTIRSLRYITESPMVRDGGFHPQVVLTAKSAFYHIVRLRKLARRRKGEK